MSVLRSGWLSSELELVKDEGPEILRSFVYSLEPLHEEESSKKDNTSQKKHHSEEHKQSR